MVVSYLTVTTLSTLGKAVMKDLEPMVDTASPSANVDLTSTVTNSFFSKDLLNASQ